MKLEHQVCSLELAQKLKTLGVPQESHFKWSEHTAPETLWCINALRDLDSPAHYSVYAAFTVAELGEMLPQDYASLKASEQKWYCGTRDNIGSTHGARTEADARASMLVYLLENKLITL